MKKTSVLCLLSITILLYSCKDSFYSSIPDAPVNFKCNLLHAPYSLIKTPSQFITVKRSANRFEVYAPGIDKFYGSEYGFTFGNSGIAVGYSSFSEYCAYDLTCPLEYKLNSKKVAVELQTNELGIAKCPQCDSKYDLNNGGIPIKGESDERLKPYPVIVQGDELIVRK